MGRKVDVPWEEILKDEGGSCETEKMQMFMDKFPSLSAMQIEVERRTGRKVALSSMSRGCTKYGLSRLNSRLHYDKPDFGPKRYEVSPSVRFDYKGWLDKFLTDRPDIAELVKSYNERVTNAKDNPHEGGAASEATLRRIRLAAYRHGIVF